MQPENVPGRPSGPRVNCTPKALQAGKAGSSELTQLSSRFMHQVSQAQGQEVRKVACNLPESLALR